jgi:hypothetical protein
MVNLKDRPMGWKKHGSREMRQGKDTMEVGQTTIDDRSESVLGEFESCMSHFHFW